MSCSSVRDALLAGRPLSEADDQHVEACELCLELVADGLLTEGLCGEVTATVDVEAMLGGVRAAVKQDQTGWRAALRRLPTSQRMGIALGVAALVMIGVGLGRRRVDFELYPAVRMWGVLVLFALVAVRGLLLSMRPAWRNAVDELRRPVLLGLALPFVLAVLPVAHEAHAASIVADKFAMRAMVCFGYGTAMAAFSGAGWWLVNREVRPDPITWMLAALGLTVVGNVALQLHCPITDPMHLLVSHATLGVVWVPLVWWVATRRGS